MPNNETVFHPSSDCEHRIAGHVEPRFIRIEMTQEIHAKELESLRITQATLGTGLAKIERTLSQIKWIAIGALSVALADKAGVLPILKAALLGI